MLAEVQASKEYENPSSRSACMFDCACNTCMSIEASSGVGGAFALAPLVVFDLEDIVSTRKSALVNSKPTKLHRKKKEKAEDVHNEYNEIRS